MEYKLWALLLLIADRGGLRKARPGTRGFVLDAGAHDGSTAMMLVNAMRHLRLHVLALEPLMINARAALRRAEKEPDLYVRRLALGDVDGATGYYPAEYDARQSTMHLQIARWRDNDNAGNVSYPITTIDALFDEEWDRTLVLAHLDLEGREPDALRGGNAVFQRDRPMITVETYPKSMRPRHEAVMAQLEALRYDVYTIEETVGTIRDGRNSVAIPREDRRLHWIVEQYFATP